MTKPISGMFMSYVGTAGHLYWLVTGGRKHPRLQEIEIETQDEECKCE